MAEQNLKKKEREVIFCCFWFMDAINLKYAQRFAKFNYLRILGNALNLKLKVS